ncbi:MAG: hypothetical protein LBE60_12945 [Microbacterium sp.]|jgi:hypothetical protein|uniref:hypothetical protein n=1 Tax=Microbacterium sp. TaxID=51671 RepID=UPI0028318257|nr:hypothetical protein [Microbacterium sp.]MDR2322545.1 hypothetical protein [Microbacterium sp.]
MTHAEAQQKGTTREVRVALHPRALERFRDRSGKSVSRILFDVGMNATDFRTCIHGGFTLNNVARLADALGTTPRELITASTVQATADQLRRTPATREEAR